MLTPQPAWLAAKLLKIGNAPGLAMLGAGLLGMRCNDQDQDVVSEAYRQLAMDTNPIATLRDMYYRFGELNGYLLEAVAPLLAFLDQPDPATEERITRCAAMLAEVDLLGAQFTAGGELLGQVYHDMFVIGRQRDIPSRLHRLDTIIPELIGSPLLEKKIGKGKSKNKQWVSIDGWCASGVRVMALSLLQYAMGGDMTAGAWHCIDPDPINIAIAAINFTCIGLDKVTFACGDGIATRAWLEGAHSSSWDVGLDGELPNGAISIKGLKAPEAIELMAEVTMTKEYLMIDHDRLAAATAVGEAHDPNRVAAVYAMADKAGKPVDPNKLFNIDNIRQAIKEGTL